MSLPDPPPPGKPVSRLGLYIPFSLLTLLALAWSGAWIWARGETGARMDRGAAALKTAGYEIDWSERKIGGYPFRLNVTLKDVEARDASGWRLEAAKVEGQAYLHAPTRWILAAPEGLTFARPVGGPVRVTGKLLRASLSGLGKRPPNASFEGADLTFAPAAGALPFSLSTAERVEMHLRKGPDDEGGIWITVKDGRARLPGLMGRIAGNQPVSMTWDSRLTRMSAFAGADWAEAIRNWTRGGGRMTVKTAGLTAGPAVISVTSGNLGVGADGRATGTLDLTLRQAPNALATLGASGTLPEDRAAAAAAVISARQGTGDIARATLTFEAGETTLGPIAIAPAPHVFTPR